MYYKSFLSLFVLSIILLVSCKDAGKADSASEVKEENKEAKALLQGIWLDEEDGEVSLKVKGDSIIYADSTLAPVSFAIIDDSLVVHGFNDMQYAIVKQTEHLFQFRNSNGDIVKFVKSDNPADDYVFQHLKPVTLNQNQLIKRDSVIFNGPNKYHVYVQVNPSTYKVISTSYNDDGVQVDNVYYDNIINLCVYEGSQRLFSSDFHKQDFKKYVPSSYLSQSILSDITVDTPSDKGLNFLASVCVPDSPTSYLIRLTVSPSGKLSMSMGE